jgi:hypothetical protein
MAPVKLSRRKEPNYRLGRKTPRENSMIVRDRKNWVGIDGVGQEISDKL